MKTLKTLLDLFWVFLNIGAVMFGGGYAMLPILTRELVEKRNWTTDEELTDYFAISQCTPGVIAVNVATFIGNKKKGFFGGLFATLGVVFVPTIIILIIAMFLSNFAENEFVKDALKGISVCVCVLIINAVVKLWSKSVVDKTTFFIFLIAFLLSASTLVFPTFKISPVLLVLAGGLVGIIIKCFIAKGGNSK